MAKAARYCAIVTGVLQLLLALFALWILVDLNANGAQLTSLTLALSAGFALMQMCVLVLAWTLSPDSPRLSWLLVILYSPGLILLAVLIAIIDVFNVSIDPASMMLRPGAVLPSNEIMGSDWPLWLALLSIAAVILLGIVPLLLLCASMFWGWRGSRLRISTRAAETEGV
ncbi:MAG: hypothetical protein SGI88_10085 [Candidatus Hydrogenedentes bacterium]|nr:hypothetical protein [Candidatus Hydrogenedentota bacterium]